MKRHLFLALALVTANALAQMPGFPIGQGSQASGSTREPQPFGIPSSGGGRGIESSRVVVPSPILTPQKPFGPEVTIRPPQPHELAQRIAALSYARLAPKAALPPQPLRVAARARTSSNNLSVSSSPSGSRVLRLGTPQSSGAFHPLTVTTGTADPDGINHWWTYEEDALGGVGKYMVNVANGNLITQSDDMAVTNKGIELSFRRTYNSMSNHTYANGDGSIPSFYGDKWTNTFDAHIAYNDFSPVNGQKGVSLYDIDGARYDYAPVGDGHAFTPPAGQHAILYYDGTGYSWTKKSGTVYYFWDLNQPNSPALAGQIETIYARNHNNYLSFARTYSPNASSPTNLVTMTVTAEDGRVVTLSYGDVHQGSSPNYRVLQTLMWPDGSTTVTYGYTIQFQGSNPVGPTLTQVTSPGNGSTTSGTLIEQYNYVSGTQFLSNVNSPRYVCAIVLSNCAVNPISTGPIYSFNYDASNRLAHVYYYGNVNPNITESSGYGSGYLQPSATHDLGSVSSFRTASLSYTTGSTTWSDSDGHQSVYTFDAIGRVSQTTETTGDPSGGVSTLVTTAAWDTQNNLISTTDARANETDYAFDNNGNAIAVGEPAAPTSVNGTIVTMRATSLFSYDANNNVTSYCDPVWVHQNGKDWTSRPAPSDSLCPDGSGTTVMGWTNPGSYEPFGQLTQLTKPLGYVSTFVYSAASQGGADYGLPTSVTGTNFTQADGTHVTPLQSFVYDAHGNVVCYSNGTGTWIMQYDALNRRTAVGDPDDASLTSPACSKTPGLSGSHIQTTTVYLANGQVSSSQTPSEYQAGVSSSYTYDADGNKVTEVKHFSSVAGTTTNLYDGADRLVEVQKPYDSRTYGDSAGYDYYPYPWITRYFYDLTQGGTVSVGATTGIKAYGNLFKTQEYVSVWGGAAVWSDLNGNGFDALDRATAKYAYQPVLSGDSEVTWTTTYDGSSASLGLVTQKADPRGNLTSYQYDSIGRTTNISFPSGPDVPNSGSRSYSFDPDGRTVAATSSVLGTQSYVYDADGRLTSESEPNYSGATSPATLTYAFYPNGWKEDLSIASSAFTMTNAFQYSYRTDGRKDWEQVTYGNGNRIATFSTTLTSGGRITSSQDPYGTANYSYLSSGLTASHSLSVGGTQAYSLAGFTYDPESELLSFNVAPSSVSYSYNVRGELISSSTSPKPTVYRGQNGYMHARRYGQQYPPNYIWADDGVNFDGLNAVGLSDSSIFGGGAGPFTYDQDARQATDGECFQYHIAHFFDCFQGTSTRSFDSENHLQSLSSSPWGVPQGCGAGMFFGQVYFSQSITDSRTYYWGPNGHPMVINSYTTVGSTQKHVVHTLHWDGDSLLFTTNASGQMDDLKIENAADYTPLDPTYSGLTLWDRDTSGTTFASHNSVGASAPLFEDPHQVQSCFFTQTAPTTFNWITTTNSGNLTSAQAGLLSQIRADGFFDGFSQIQGGRTYNDASSSWTTPDAYAGEVNDPASQKAYMWNRNNPVTFSDPTGFDAIAIPWSPGFSNVAQGLTTVSAAIGGALAAAGELAAGAAAGAGAVATAGFVLLGTQPAGLANEAELTHNISVQEKERLLPRQGDIVFRAPKTSSGNIPRDRQGGFRDANGNSWRWDTRKGEWDVQHPDGSHTNVSPDGKVTHGPNNFPPGSRNNKKPQK
jgi:YD repeat-containing protein